MYHQHIHPRADDTHFTGERWGWIGGEIDAETPNNGQRVKSSPSIFSSLWKALSLFPNQADMVSLNLASLQQAEISSFHITSAGSASGLHGHSGKSNWLQVLLTEAAKAKAHPNSLPWGLVDLRQLSCLCQRSRGYWRRRHVLTKSSPFFCSWRTLAFIFQASTEEPVENQAQFLPFSSAPCPQLQSRQREPTSYNISVQFSRSVMSDSLRPHGRKARQASLSVTTSQSLLKHMSVESVMPSNHLILCHALLLLPTIFKGSSWGRTLVEMGRGEGQPVVLKRQSSYFSLCFPNSEGKSWFSSISLLTLLHRCSPNVWNFGTKQFSNCRSWNPYNLIRFWHHLPGASTDSPRLRAPSRRPPIPKHFGCQLQVRIVTCTCNQPAVSWSFPGPPPQAQ